MKKLLSVILCICIVFIMSSCEFMHPEQSIKDILGNVPDDITIPTIKPAKDYVFETPTPSPTPKGKGPTLELKLNQTVTVGDAMEITLESSEWAERILPPDTSGSYSYVDDKEDEKYFVVKGKVKNLAGENLEISFRGIKASLLINGKYKADVEINGVQPTAFYGDIKPLQTLDVIFYASVTDEVYDLCNYAELTLKAINDANYISTYFQEEDVPFNTYIIKFTN